jgi:3alpha(or 20beta)-hydroxysteroid dehydrogenase
MFLDDDGKELAEELGKHAGYSHHDVTSEAQWDAVVAAATSQFGRLDVLVNNAGVFLIKAMAKTSLEDYMRVVTINQVGSFLGMKAVAETMIDQGCGSIVSISSTSGLTGSPGTVAYAASKFAIRGMTKVAAAELAQFGVRVNSVHPGIVDDTTMAAQVRGAFGDEPVEALKARIPSGRFAAADEVARLVVYLASDESSYSTGSEFVVDGGYTAV